MGVKIIFPYGMKIVKWEQFFGISGLWMIALAVITTNPALLGFKFSISILLLLWIPYAAAYSLNRPKKSYKWFLMLLIMLVSFVYAALRAQEYYSSVFLLQIVLTAILTVIISEFIRNRRILLIGILNFSVCIIIIAILSVIIRKFVGEPVMWSYIQNELEYKVFWWENLREYCVQVLRNARWIGRANMDFEIFIYYI